MLLSCLWDWLHWLRWKARAKLVRGPNVMMQSWSLYYLIEAEMNEAADCFCTTWFNFSSNGNESRSEKFLLILTHSGKSSRSKRLLVHPRFSIVIPLNTGTLVPAICWAISASWTQLSRLRLPFTQVIPITTRLCWAANFKAAISPMISSWPPWVSRMIYLSSSLTVSCLISLTCIGLA